MTPVENYSREIGLIVFLVVLGLLVVLISLLCWLLWRKLQKFQKTGKTLPLVNCIEAPTPKSLYSYLSYINAPDLEFLYTDINEHTIVCSTLFSKKEEKPVRKFQKEKGLLFEDPDFSPKDALPNASSDIKWLRPHEIVSNPEFFTDGQSRFDVVQGAIADCWFLAAVATISMCDGLFFRVVPPDQGFSKKEGYVGIFYFHFWRYGEWVEVVVDDRLITRV